MSHMSNEEVSGLVMSGQDLFRVHGGSRSKSCVGVRLCR